MFVNLFIASELTWKTKGIHLRQETKFPDADTTTLIFQCDQPEKLTLHLRHPYWVTNGFAVAVNGQPLKVKSQPRFIRPVHRIAKLSGFDERHLSCHARLFWSAERLIDSHFSGVQDRAIGQRPLETPLDISARQKY